MQKQAVIAKYAEDISWTTNLECPVIIYDKFQDKDLPNIGRDLHTYAHHVATRYDNLAELTFFLQGNPFDHCRGVVGQVNELEAADFYPLTDIRRLTHKSGLPYYDRLPMEPVYRELTGRPLPELIIFISGAQFAASRERLHRLPQATYARMAEMAAQVEHYPHIFERLIGILIGGERKWGIDKNSPAFVHFMEMMMRKQARGERDLILSSS